MNKMFLNISLSLLSGVFTVFVLSVLGFILNVSIISIYTIAGLLATLAVFVVRLKKEGVSLKKSFLLCAILATGLITAVHLAGILMDASWDGKAYHQVAVLLLEKGWNPVYNDITNFCLEHFDTAPHELIWCENYVKFSEIFAANIMSITGKIETGKAFNIISAAITFFYLLYFFSKKRFKNINTIVKALFSLLLIYNPIVVSQFFTYYVDGLLYLYFLTATFSATNWILKNLEGKNGTIHLIIFIMSSTVMVNIKLGGIFCFVCILLGILIFQTFYRFYRLKTNKTIDLTNNCPLKPFWCSVLIIIILALLSGINPYFTNILKGRHAFYPLAGKGKIDIITPNAPKAFEDKPLYYKFFTSLFSKTNNFLAAHGKTPKLKIPFTVYKSELLPMKDVDTRIAGFGVFFSGIFLFALVLFIATLYKKHKNSGQRTDEAFILLFLIFGLSVLSNPENWWARYVPQLWALTMLAGLFACTAPFKNKQAKKVLLASFAMLAFLNTLFINILNLCWSINYTTKIKESIYNIKLHGSKAMLHIPPEAAQTELSYLRKLDEAKVKYELIRQQKH